MAKRRGNGFYAECELDEVMKVLLEEEQNELVLDVESEQELPEGVHEVERVVERRVRKVSHWSATILQQFSSSIFLVKSHIS